MNFSELKSNQLIELLDNRWASSETLWAKIKKIYEANTAACSNNPPWVRDIPSKYPRITNGRLFTNNEAVINSLISNPPKPNTIPNRQSEDAVKAAQSIEKLFVQRYHDLNIKEVFRTALRDLSYARLFCIKPFWNSEINDFDTKRINPLKIRLPEKANKETDCEYIFEEIDITLWSLINKYPKEKDNILREAGYSEAEAMIQNPSVCYRECWIGNYLVVRYQNIILWKGRNPYWDWDGILATKDEMNELLDDEKDPKAAIERLMKAEDPVLDETGQPVTDELAQPVMRSVQEVRRTEQKAVVEANKEKKEKEDELPYEAYLFNHFDKPRKPYIFGTVLKNEDGPIGRTSVIEMATPLAEVADRLKFQIYKNARLMNGVLKVDSRTMPQEKAEQLRYDIAGGTIYGQGVVNGVKLETGEPMPAFVFEDLQQTLNEIDNIMAATSAFRGEREGQETKAGRLALIEQSFLRLNELVQVVDFMSKELFDWWFQLAKTRYTERHYTKFMGPDGAVETIELTRNDFEKGMQIRIIPGKTLPEDRQFKYQRAQEDVAAGRISNPQYLKDAGYENPTEVAQEAFLYQQNPPKVLGLQPALPQPTVPTAADAPPAIPVPEQAAMSPVV